MANKVIDISNSVTKYDILSQTPKNYSKDNYWLKELQHKVNIEWKYRPNRVDMEYENTWGEEKWTPIEVVVQTVRNDKGQDLSDNCRRLVFRDIHESRFRTGNKFRFSRNYDLEAADIRKNVWLVSNYDTVSMTSSVVIEKCNGNIGSTWIDEQGVTHYHYEPVIQGRELTNTDFRYDDPVAATQGKLVITCQHNKYTKNYFINQRFIIGYNAIDEGGSDEFPTGKGQVYRITAINKYYTNTTYMPDDVGLIRLYLEKTESSPYDNFITRIAYQMDHEVHMVTTGGGEEKPGEKGVKTYSIKFNEPEFIPSGLTSETITFKPVVICNEDGVEVAGVPINFDIELQRLPEGVDISNYVEETVNNVAGAYELKRKRMYLNGNLVVTCTVAKEDSPSGEEMTTQFELTMSTRE